MTEWLIVLPLTVVLCAAVLWLTRDIWEEHAQFYASARKRKP